MGQKILLSFIASLALLSNIGCTHPALNESGTRAPNQAQDSSPGVVSITNPAAYSLVYVISDVHGMYDNVIPLLQAGKVIDKNGNWAAGNALFIVTGDSIDKGSKSIEVIDLWIKLQQQARSAGGDLIHTLGNHEAEFLATPNASNKKAIELISEMQQMRIPLSDLTTTSTVRGRFIHAEPVTLRVGNWLFSHSGYYPNMSWNDFSRKANSVIASQAYDDDFLIGSDSILEMKKWEIDPSLASGVLSRMSAMGIYGSVFGHQPEAFGVKKRSAARAQGRLIKIDNGMAPEAGANPGSLLVFASPQQMTGNTYPDIRVIFPDGSLKALQPQ